MQIEAIKRECFCLKTAYRNKGSKLKYIGKSAFALYAKSMELEEAVEKAVENVFMMEFWKRERNRERKASGKIENSTDISGKWNVPSFFR